MAFRSRAAAAGLALRGACHPEPRDRMDAGTLVLLGFAGAHGWPEFAASGEARDGLPDPLDRWSRRVIDALAASCGGAALYPFGGPPWHPFQRWAQRSESVYPSPLGILIHPEFGLWHAYRAAFLLPDPVELPPAINRASPCDSCTDRPCLNTCPVDAFSINGYDVETCASHVNGTAGETCRSQGCLARLACPIGAAWQYESAHAAFHMAAFRRSHPGTS